MATRLFDPVQAQDLLNASLEANATRRDPLPAGETVAQIMEVGFSSGESGPNSKRPGTPWTRLDLKLEITDPEYLAEYSTDADKVVTNLGIMLDMNNGQIAVGPNKNVRLGRLREAAGCNGRPLSDLAGNYIRIMVAHKPHPSDPDTILDDITGYTKP